MKTLFTPQRESVDFHLRSLQKIGASLDTSHTGVGKTVVAAFVAKELGLPVAVVCPKIVIPHWKRELAEVGVEPVFVLNYEKIKRGNTYLAKIGKKLFRWLLPQETLIIWDEVHKCKSPFSQNSQMLVAAKQAGLKNLMLSATACQDPTEMRSIGYALNCHSLNKADYGLKSWFSWMQEYGCRKDNWGNWLAGPVKHLIALNQRLYGSCAVKLTASDLPSAFSANHVIREPLEFRSLSDIGKFYEAHGITPEIVEQYISGEVSPPPNVLVEILRARQLAEAAKVSDIIEMVEDAVSEGFHTAVFVNFVDSVNALTAEFGDRCAVIVGGQSAQDREDNVQSFQRGERKIIVANIAAGGVGVSLHDTVGGQPRMSFISPTFNAKDYIQTLGRISRAGAKTPATQRILVASGTIEEKIVDALEKKRISLETLHAKPQT